MPQKDPSVDDQLRTLATGLGKTAEWTDRDYLCLAAVFYKDTFKRLDDEAGNGWSEIDIANADNGYDAIALWHELTGSLVIVNRGAEGGFLSRDFIEGYQAALDTGRSAPLEDALDQALDWVRWCRNNKELQEIRIAGHSWGGALSESLAMLLPAALKEDAPKIQARGYGSAGFERAISSLAARRGLVLQNESTEAIRHYVRGQDPIRWALARWFGEVRPLGSIWAESRSMKMKGPSKTITTAMPGINHDRRYYFRYFKELDPAHHLLISLNGKETVREGSGPH